MHHLQTSTSEQQREEQQLPLAFSTGSALRQRKRSALVLEQFITDGSTLKKDSVLSSITVLCSKCHWSTLVNSVLQQVLQLQK